jgi:outer membrane protein
MMTRVTIGARLGLVCAAFCAVTSTGAQAQQRTGVIPDTLSLPQALQLAHTHSPVFLQTSNDDDVASAAVRSAWGQLLPNLSANMNISGSQSHVETYPDPVTQKPQRLPEPATSSGSGLSQGLSMGVTLFDGGRTLRQLAAQRASERASAAYVASQATTLDAGVRTSFFQALRAEQNIALSERLLASAQDRLAQTEALFRTASKGQVDLLGAREEIATQQLSLERAKDDATKARLALAQIIGIPSDGSFALAGQLPEIYDPATLSLDGLLTQALQSNPVVLRQELNATVAEKQAAAAKGSRWPSLSANLSYGRSVSVPEYGAFSDAYKYLNPQNSHFSFGFGVSLPVFTRFSTASQITSARAAAQDAQLQLAATRLQVETDVRTAYIDFVNAFHSLQLADTKAALSQERLTLSQDQYRAGSITFSDLQQIIDRAASSERDALNARFTWITALIQLELKVGSPVVR